MPVDEENRILNDTERMSQYSLTSPSAVTAAHMDCVRMSANRRIATSLNPQVSELLCSVSADGIKDRCDRNLTDVIQNCDTDT